ncbi:uncharacterized protein LOC131938141 [Physella acuta]|uniref:uncharacterized protein LOC131938141 n=1 Tax=Physella acuta TaxID=109671 RepID=UPI0027DBA887|nr:uncharacterized protein LOC131938141 [Physella acuta]
MSSKRGIFIVGLNGSGKTSTWKSILSKLNPDSKVINIQGSLNINIGTSVVQGREVTVIDGNLVGDTETDLQCSKASLATAVRKAIPPTGFHALVLVLKYGTTYPKLEEDAIYKIKSLFGYDVFKKRGVLVFTHGDIFEIDHEDKSVSFNDWCKEQKGDIAELFKECGHRYVLFNNKSQDKQSMVRMLMDMVDMFQRLPYTRKQFDKFGGKNIPPTLLANILNELRSITPHTQKCMIIIWVILYFIFDGWYNNFSVLYTLVVKGANTPLLEIIFGTAGCLLYKRVRYPQATADIIYISTPLFTICILWIVLYTMFCFCF